MHNTQHTIHNTHTHYTTHNTQHTTQYTTHTTQHTIHNTHYTTHNIHYTTQYTFTTLRFRGTAQKCIGLRPLDFLVNLKTTAYSTLTENKEILHQRNFDAFQTICNRPATFEMIQQFRIKYARVRVSIQRGDILGICCGLWLDEQ